MRRDPNQDWLFVLLLWHWFKFIIILVIAFAAALIATAVIGESTVVELLSIITKNLVV